VLPGIDTLLLIRSLERGNALRLLVEVELAELELPRRAARRGAVAPVFPVFPVWPV